MLCWLSAMKLLHIITLPVQGGVASGHLNSDSADAVLKLVSVKRDISYKKQSKSLGKLTAPPRELSCL